MADRAASRGSGDGIDGAILATGLGSTGTVLAGNQPEAGRCRPDVGSATSGAGAIQSRAAGTQEGFPRCRTSGKATGSQRADPEFCARRRTATVAHGHTPKVPADTRQSAVAEPIGGTAGRGSY